MNDLEFIAPMVVCVVLILTAGGVLILRPLSGRLAELLEAMTRDREEPKLESELAHLRDVMETVTQRLTLLEERQDFTDQLLSRGRGEESQTPRRIGGGGVE